jgi:hypothetical protein
MVQRQLIIHPTIRRGLLPYVFAILRPIAVNSTPKKNIDPNKLISMLGAQYKSISEIQFIKDL